MFCHHHSTSCSMLYGVLLRSVASRHSADRIGPCYSFDRRPPSPPPSRSYRPGRSAPSRGRARPIAVKTFMSSGEVLAPALVTHRRNSTHTLHLPARCRQVRSYGQVVNGDWRDTTERRPHEQRTTNASNCLSTA